jgi:hypothetical protein
VSSTTERLIRDLIEYREHAIAFWRERDTDAANAHTDAGDKIIQRWTAEGNIRDILLPLLKDSAPEVRYAAAADLLGIGESAQAIPVLEELSNTSPVSAAADLMLVEWREKQGSQ